MFLLKIKVKQRLSVIFSILCVLSTEEITLWIQHVYRKYALDDAGERFPEFDANKDGVVTWEEYNAVAHDQLISFDENTVLNDPEQESLRQVGEHLSHDS